MSSPTRPLPSTPPRTPTRTPSSARRGICAINPPGYHSPIPSMALNAEPADPSERQEQHLPVKSYADAAEEALAQHDRDEAIDEESIKESPPRAMHQRVPSTPRPLGEVIEEDERVLPPGSPTLRHKNGSIGHDAHKESYAEAVKEHEPARAPTPPSEMQTNVNGNSNKLPHGNGPNGAPTSYSGIGIDETPRSPIRKAHKRVSSRSLNGIAQKQAQHTHLNGAGGGNQNEITGSTTRSEMPATESAIVEEAYRSKSGHSLASIEVGGGFETSLKQRENKQYTTEPTSQPSKHQRLNSELVSGRRAGAGWSQSAIRWAPANVPLQRRLQTLMVLMHTLSIAGGLALFFLLCTIPLLWPVLLPYLIYVLLSSAGTSGQLSHRSEWLRRSKVWSLFASYFPARLHRTTRLEPTRKYIFGYHPHGIISHGAFAAFATEALGFGQLFPGKHGPQTVSVIVWNEIC